MTKKKCEELCEELGLDFSKERNGQGGFNYVVKSGNTMICKEDYIKDIYEFLTEVKKASEDSDSDFNVVNFVINSDFKKAGFKSIDEESEENTEVPDDEIEEVEDVEETEDSEETEEVDETKGDDFDDEYDHFIKTEHRLIEE